MSALYNTYLKEVRDFLDYAESMEVAIQDTLTLLHNQLNELDALQTKAFDLTAKNDMISNDNMHSLEFLNCTAVELTQIASRQRALLVERRRAKNLSVWIKNNQQWKSAILNLLGKYTLSDVSQRYTYRTEEGFSLVESFNNATARMNTTIRKPHSATTDFYKRNVIKKIISNHNKEHAEEVEEVSPEIKAPVSIQVPVKKTKHDVSPKHFPLLNQLVPNLKSTISFQPFHQLDMRSIRMNKKKTRYVISKKGNAFVLYDVENNLLLFQTGRISQLFRCMKAHNIDLLNLSCSPSCFTTIAHYINSSLMTKKHHGLDIEFIKKVATTAFNRS